MIQKTARPALLIAAADLFIKLIPLGGDRTLIPGVLMLHPVTNHGVAFGFFAASPLVNIALTGIITLAAAVWLYAHPPRGLFREGAAMMLGGSLGNLLDRAIHGAVSDYLLLTFVSFPVFNLADIFITLGAGILILSLLLSGKAENQWP